MRLTLASNSPRRVELLTAAGFEFDVMPVAVDESRQDGEAPVDYVMRLARAKAAEGARHAPGRPVIGADTVVIVGGRLLGKPAGDAEAADMLRLLSGRTHEVLTAVALRMPGDERCEVESTRVSFVELSADEIAWYVASGEPRDKAGAYAVQGLGSRFVVRIEGSYTNVVGLPVALVYRLVRGAEARGGSGRGGGAA